MISCIPNQRPRRPPGLDAGGTRHKWRNGGDDDTGEFLMAVDALIKGSRKSRSLKSLTLSFSVCTLSQRAELQEAVKGQHEVKQVARRRIRSLNGASRAQGVSRVTSYCRILTSIGAYSRAETRATQMKASQFVWHTVLRVRCIPLPTKT